MSPEKQEGSEGDSTPKPLLRRNYHAENSLRLVAVLLLITSAFRFVGIGLAVHVNLGSVVIAALLAWAALSFFRLGPHGRIAASVGVGFMIVRGMIGAILGLGGITWGHVLSMGAPYVVALSLVWRPPISPIFSAAYQTQLVSRWRIHRAPLGSRGWSLVGLVLWAAAVSFSALRSLIAA